MPLPTQRRSDLSIRFAPGSCKKFELKLKGGPSGVPFLYLKTPTHAGIFDSRNQPIDAPPGIRFHQGSDAHSTRSVKYPFSALRNLNSRNIHRVFLIFFQILFLSFGKYLLLYYLRQIEGTLARDDQSVCKLVRNYSNCHAFHI
jgi:hypothetical protein